MIDLVNYLQKHQTIQFSNTPLSWEDAITNCLMPLVNNQSISKNYIQQIIKQTPKTDALIPEKKILILSHPDFTNVLHNSFAFLISRVPIQIQSTKVQIIVGVVAKNDQDYFKFMLPQIVSLFESKDISDQLLKTNSISQVIALFKSYNYRKYIQQSTKH